MHNASPMHFGASASCSNHMTKTVHDNDTIRDAPHLLIFSNHGGLLKRGVLSARFN